MQSQSESAGKPIVFRNTNARKGRHVSVNPHNSAMKHLSYARIILDMGLPEISFDTAGQEVGLICLSGAAIVKVGGKDYQLARYDAIYIPRDSSVQISTSTSVDFAECSAPVQGSYPVQLVPYSDVESSSSLKFTTGGASNTRTVNILLGRNIQAGRILAGFTTSAPGNWTSWPPHEHATMLEELYVYYDMPPPAFGVQFVYTNPDEPEFAGIVRDGDAVLMPHGFHPNVSIPGHQINFVWMMAAQREVQDRQYGVVNVQPGFDKGGTGLEASLK